MNKAVTYSRPNPKLIEEMQKLLKGRTGNAAYKTVRKRLAAPQKTKKRQTGRVVRGEAEAWPNG